MLNVTEIFHSIQGESTYAGLPCVFVRLTGCNLRCNYCDTTYAYSNGAALTINSILNQVAAFSCPLVEITGGEPLLQPETPALIRELLRCEYKVLVETNGSLNIDLAPAPAVRIVDLKCPGSGEMEQMDWENLRRLRPTDEIKCVISDVSDFHWALEKLQPYQSQLRQIPILFAPVWGRVAPADLAQWILASRQPVRLQLQLHKLIWDATHRGV